jgi:hypothetical protein
MTERRPGRRTLAVCASVVAAGGVPAALVASDAPVGYGDVVLFVGLALVPLLAIPTWESSDSPLLGWVQLAYPLLYSSGFLWASAVYQLTWLWPLLVFAGNLSFVAYWWLATIDDDGRLGNPLARLVVAVGTVLWVGVGLVIMFLWVPRPGWRAEDAYAVFPSRAAMRYLDQDWNAVTWTYSALLVAVALLTTWLALHTSARERTVRWLIALTATIDAVWVIWLEISGADTGSGVVEALSIAEQFTAIVAIPYLVVLLTRRARSDVSASVHATF